MTEAEALKRFIPILGRISTPYERATIVMRVNERINDTQRTSLLGVTRRHVAALAWPSDPVQAKQFEDKLNAAVDAGDFVSLIRDGKHLQIEELLAWPDCPSIAPDSPLTFWLGEPAPAQSPARPAPVPPASDCPSPLPAVPNWKMLIQAEAAELFLRLLASGANPTPHSLVKPMAKWCRDNEIKTDGNINPSEGYIRTHVLGGDHWTPPTMNREQARKHVAQVAQTKVAQVAQ